MPAKTRNPPSGTDLGSPMARVSANGCVIEIPGETNLSLDPAGRWLSVRLDRQLYRRVLDGSVVIYPGPTQPPEDVDDADHVHRRVAELARAIELRFRSHAGGWKVTVDPQCEEERLPNLLRHAAAMTPASFEGQRERYLAAYPDEAIEILPPDRYRDLVVLPATGCPNGQCSFCVFYRDRPLRRLSEEAFSAHLEAVKTLFGQALPSRTGIFLGSASALSLSQSRLLAVLEEVGAAFGPRPRGIAAFWDPDHCPKRDADAWRALQASGLDAAYVGLETGLAELRGAIGKSRAIDQLIDAVRELEGTSIRRGLIILVGVGGESQIDAHHQATVRAIEAMNLSARDRVYLSPLAEGLDSPRLERETSRLRETLRSTTAAKVARYAIDSFRYYA